MQWRKSSAPVLFLRKNGVDPQAICRAMAKVIMDFCDEEYYQCGPHRLWAKKFIKEAGEAFQCKAEIIGYSEDRVYWERKLAADRTAGSC